MSLLVFGHNDHKCNCVSTQVRKLAKEISVRSTLALNLIIEDRDISDPHMNYAHNNLLRPATLSLRSRGSRSKFQYVHTMVLYPVRHPPNAV